MGVAIFDPYQQYEGARARGCFTCAHFQGEWSGHVLTDDTKTGVYPVCRYRGETLIVSYAERGCVHWQREPGSDDE
jgi:hypothetical protein